MTHHADVQLNPPTAEPQPDNGGAPDDRRPTDAALPADDGQLSMRPGMLTPEAAETRWLTRLAVGVVALAVGGGALFVLLRAAGPRPLLGSAEAPAVNGGAGEDAGAIPVNTVFPKRKTLVRTFEQAGSIESHAKVELYSKVPGYLKMLARDLTPRRTADLAARQLTVPLAAPAGPPVAPYAQLAVAAELAYWGAREKDFGSPVAAGELLLVIDAPELLQEIAQREATWKQRSAELEAARTGLATYQAQLHALEAQKKQAEADVKRAASDHAYYSKQLSRLRELVRRETIAPEMADEKLHQVEAAQAAWDSSHAKVQAVQAELAVLASKLATAKADLRVKEAQVHVAVQEWHRAEIQAEYAHVHAPFDGIITQRDVDEGDFVQNSTSGQTRRLMTIEAIDRVKVVLKVPEREAIWVEPGAEAVIRLDARARWQVKGRVARVAHALDNEARTMRVEIDLPNADRKLRRGFYAHVTLILQKIEDTPAIPATAVYSRGGENYIIQAEGGEACHQRVQILYDDGKEMVVAKLVGGREVPLEGSEELVVSNKGELRDGQRVRTTAPAGP